MSFAELDRATDLLAAHLQAHQHEEGVDPTVLDRIHAPIGLAIGALGPQEIAMAVAGELIAVRRGAVQLRPLRMPTST